jgi:hypothetical protein
MFWRWVATMPLPLRREGNKRASHESCKTAKRACVSVCLAALFFTKAYPRVLLRLHSGMYLSTIPPSVILAGHHGSIFRFEEAVHSHPDTYPSFGRVSGIRNRATVAPAFGL